MKLLKNSMLYSVVAFLQKGIGFFLLPLYTSFLSPYDYGVVATVTSVCTVLQIIASLSINSAVTRFFFIHFDDRDEYKKILGNVVFLVFVSNAFVLLLSVCCRSVFIRYITKGIDYFPLVFFQILSFALFNVYSVVQSVLQVRQEGTKFAANNLVFFVLQLCLNIVLIVLLKYRSLGLILSGLIVNVISFVYAIFMLRAMVLLSISKERIRSILRYCLPLLPHDLSVPVSGALDKVLISSYRKVSDVGIYNISYQFGSIVNIILFAVQQAFTPWFYENIATQDGRKKINTVSMALISLFCLLGLLISLFTPEVLSFMVNDRYNDAWKYVPLIVVSYFFLALYGQVCNVLFLEKTYAISVISISLAIFNCLLSLLCVPLYGVYGACIANIVIQIARSLIIIILAEKRVKIGNNYYLLYVQIILTSIACFAPFAMTNLSFICSFVIKTIIAGVILVVFLMINKIDLRNYRAYARLITKRGE